jgi:hypothetical protein
VANRFTRDFFMALSGTHIARRKRLVTPPLSRH